jgi:hypothetical protein
MALQRNGPKPIPEIGSTDAVLYFLHAALLAVDGGGSSAEIPSKTLLGPTAFLNYFQIFPDFLSPYLPMGCAW